MGDEGGGGEVVVGDAGVFRAGFEATEDAK